MNTQDLAERLKRIMRYSDVTNNKSFDNAADFITTNFVAREDASNFIPAIKKVAEALGHGDWISLSCILKEISRLREVEKKYEELSDKVNFHFDIDPKPCETDNDAWKRGYAAGLAVYGCNKETMNAKSCDMQDSCIYARSYRAKCGIAKLISEREGVDLGGVGCLTGAVNQRPAGGLSAPSPLPVEMIKVYSTKMMVNGRSIDYGDPIFLRHRDGRTEISTDGKVYKDLGKNHLDNSWYLIGYLIKDRIWGLENIEELFKECIESLYERGK